jgi:hypothetical protein
MKHQFMFYVTIGGIALGVGYMFNIMGIRDKINALLHKPAAGQQIIQPGPGVDPMSFDYVKRTGNTSAVTPDGHVVTVMPPSGLTKFGKAYQGITLA